MAAEPLSTVDVASAAGVGVQTVRYNERIGIIPEPDRSPGGYRRYRTADVRRLRFIRGAQRLGFSLDEIRGLLALRVEAGPTCAEVRHRADQVVERIDTRIRELEEMKRALIRLRVACEAETPVEDCAILDALEAEAR